MGHHTHNNKTHDNLHSIVKPIVGADYAVTGLRLRSDIRARDKLIEI